MPPDGAGGKGHFSTVAELWSRVTDLEKRVKAVELDLTTLTDSLLEPKPPRKKRRRRRPVMKP